MADLKTWFGKFRKFTQEIRLNQNIATYLICVVIASILWFLNMLSQDYTTELTYPIRYINIPEDKYPTEKLPDHLQLDVQAKGFTLLGFRIKTSFQPITFNFSTYSHQLQEKDGVSEYILNTNDIKEKLGTQISPDIKLLAIYPEKIAFRFAAAQRKKVAVRPILDYTLKRQYILNRVTLSPDSVVVSGPANVVDTLTGVDTEKWELRDLSSTARKTLKLKELGSCHLRNETTEAVLEIEQFTEANRTINITPLGVPDSLNMRLFPSTVNVTYNVGLSKYEKITDDDFIFTVIYPMETDAPYLEVKLQRAPAFIKDLVYTPQKVEFLLEKK